MHQLVDVGVQHAGAAHRAVGEDAIADALRQRKLMRRRGEHRLLAEGGQQGLGIGSCRPDLLQRRRHDAADRDERARLVDLLGPLVGANQRFARDVLRRVPEVIEGGLVEHIELQAAGGGADELAHLGRQRHGLADGIEAAEAKLLAGVLGFDAGHEDAAALTPGRRLGHHPAVVLPLLGKVQLPVAGQADADQLGGVLGNDGSGHLGRHGLALEAALRQRGNMHPQRACREYPERPQQRPPVHEIPSPKAPRPGSKIAPLARLRERLSRAT